MNFLRAQLAGHRPEDAGADRLALLVDQHGRVAVEADGAAVDAAQRISLAVRTITAWCTSPFFTRPRGIASLTETTITSPTLA